MAGAVDDVEACHAALRRWLARHATLTLSPWLANLAEPAGLRYADVAIKNQRTLGELFDHPAYQPQLQIAVSAA
ncbi:MAG: hypothetical protein R3E83_04000 [Burkholderiaceae bacterium]